MTDDEDVTKELQQKEKHCACACTRTRVGKKNKKNAYRLFVALRTRVGDFS
jgi:hypothetical protein